MKPATFAETWDATMGLLMDGETAGNRELIAAATDRLEDLAMGDQAAYEDMIRQRRAAGAMIAEA